MKAGISIVLLSLFIAVSPAATALADVSPGKNGAYGSFSGGLPASGVPADLIEVQISKGKSRRVLEATATISIADNATAAGYNIVGRLEANGVAIETEAGVSSSVPGFHIQTCYEEAETFSVLGCVLTITGWLDLDAAELASPGTFEGQPIDVVLRGGAFQAGGGLVSGTATLNVRMNKK